MGNENIGSYSTVEKLGKGRFGKTRLCKTIDNYLIAIKIYEVIDNSIQDTLKRFNAFNKSQIKSVIKSKDIIVIDEVRFGVSMEYYDKGSLAKKLEQRTLISTVQIMKQIAKTVQNLHTNYKIPHKNIKPQNIFLIQNECFLSDLTAPGFSLLRTRQTLGSLDYQAKQTFQGVNSFASDIWSLGIIFIQLLTAQRIRNLEYLGETMRPSITRDQYPSPETLGLIQNSDLNYLIKKMVEVKPLERIDINQVVNLLEEIISTTGKLPLFSQNHENGFSSPYAAQKQFHFDFDPKHPYLNHFQLAGRKIRRVDKEPRRYQAVSKESFPSGRWFVSIKIVYYGQENDEVVMGVLSEERRKEKMSGDIDQDNSIALWTSLANHQSNLCQNGVWNNTPLPQIKERVGVLKIIVDTNQRQIIWFIDGKFVSTSKMPESYWNQQLFVFVALKGLDCQLQFGEKQHIVP